MTSKSIKITGTVNKVVMLVQSIQTKEQFKCIATTEPEHLELLSYEGGSIDIDILTLNNEYTILEFDIRPYDVFE